MVDACSGAWQGVLFFRSSGPSLARPALHPWALVTTKQYPLPIPYQIQCAFQTAGLVAFVRKSQKQLAIVSLLFFKKT